MSDNWLNGSNTVKGHTMFPVRKSTLAYEKRWNKNSDFLSKRTDYI